MKITRWSCLFNLLPALFFVQAVFAQAPMMGAARPGMVPDPNTFYPPTAAQGPTCDIDAVIYRVSLPADQISKIDLAALEKAAEKAEDFEKALAKFGKTAPLYRARQSVALGGDSIRIGAQTPFVTSSRTTETAGTTSTIQYTDVGAQFDIVGSVQPSKVIRLRMKIEVTLSSDSSTLISTNIKSQIFRSATLTHYGPVQAKKPFVFMSVDAASPDADGEAVAYIAKVKLGEPQE